MDVTNATLGTKVTGPEGTLLVYTLEKKLHITSKITPAFPFLCKDFR